MVTPQIKKGGGEQERNRVTIDRLRAGGRPAEEAEEAAAQSTSRRRESLTAPGPRPLPASSAHSGHDSRCPSRPRGWRRPPWRTQFFIIQTRHRNCFYSRNEILEDEDEACADAL